MLKTHNRISMRIFRKKKKKKKRNKQKKFQPGREKERTSFENAKVKERRRATGKMPSIYFLSASPASNLSHSFLSGCVNVFPHMCFE
jgi:hypothetical protein